jgi:hypothetical protein
LQGCSLGREPEFAENRGGATFVAYRGNGG